MEKKREGEDREREKGRGREVVTSLEEGWEESPLLLFKDIS